MPHLRLQVPEEWLMPEFSAATGFNAKTLLDHLVGVVAGMRMENAAGESVPLINLSNLKHAIEPLYYAHLAGDPSKRFLHCTLAAGNDTPGRTAAVRSRAAETLGNEIDNYLFALPGYATMGAGSVTVWVQDIDRDRGYTTTAERKKKREQAK
jgi:hypothetical protein